MSKWSNSNSFEEFLDNLITLFIARYNLIKLIKLSDLNEADSEILKIIDMKIDRLISEQRTLTR